MLSANAQRPGGGRTQITSPDQAYREEFVQLLAGLQLERTQAIALVEAATGRPFESCGPIHLVPLLEELLELVHAHRTLVHTDQSWHV